MKYESLVKLWLSSLLIVMIYKCVSLEAYQQAKKTVQNKTSKNATKLILIFFIIEATTYELHPLDSGLTIIIKLTSGYLLTQVTGNQKSPKEEKCLKNWHSISDFKIKSCHSPLRSILSEWKIPTQIISTIKPTDEKNAKRCASLYLHLCSSSA
jgi:hypothetical protein